MSYKKYWKLREEYSPFYQKTKLFINRARYKNKKEIDKALKTPDKVAIAIGYSKKELKEHLKRMNWKKRDIIFN
jgi:hypothetical protein